MKTQQFEKLIQAITGRPLTIEISLEEIPLESKITISRPWKTGKRAFAFEWKTPQKEDSLLRSFITAFCSKYLEPDPETYSRNCSAYGDRWMEHDEEWNNPETRWNCSLWNHHRGHQTSKEKLKAQVIANFANFDSGTARLGFYVTNYGIGIFTIYGGAWVQDSLAKMADYLNRKGIPYRNELSKAEWVTRFIVGLDKPSHANILSGF
jgi:hypothetical protein